MAEYLASIFGTEKDKVNCSFYFKIGACRHGDRCSRIHNKPTFSQTIVLQVVSQVRAKFILILRSLINIMSSLSTKDCKGWAYESTNVLCLLV